MWRGNSCGLANAIAKREAESGAWPCPHPPSTQRTPAPTISSQSYHNQALGKFVQGEFAQLVLKHTTASTEDRHGDIKARQQKPGDSTKGRKTATYISDLSQSTPPPPNRAESEGNRKTLHLSTGAVTGTQDCFRDSDLHFPSHPFKRVEPWDPGT
uniref:Uncharacterized protein n=1 Tax=Rousettus aegyptiacus TaxID=9407 RepID=A0A7J8EKD7_ROUAE|nr:hypothetical protein HJG63_012530 [Rousettus aegyptiacus]